MQLRLASPAAALAVAAMARNFAVTEEYFDSEHYPYVACRLLRLVPRGVGRYQAEGELTIRSFTRSIQSEVTLEINGDMARASGVLHVRRSAFHFGVGPTSLLVNLGAEVAVRFALPARRLR